MTVRVSPEVSERLNGLARDTRRSKAHLASEAIAGFVERNAWQEARIKASLEDARTGSPGIPYERVEQWMEPWDTDHELPRPKAATK
jgi:predicted transcriptional regulator